MKLWDKKPPTKVAKKQSDVARRFAPTNVARQFTDKQSYDEQVLLLKVYNTNWAKASVDRYKQCRVCTCWMPKRSHRCGFCMGLTWEPEG